MTRVELVAYCLTLPGAYEDYPFDTLPDSNRWTAMRHSGSKKTFVFTLERLGALWVNVKCEPEFAEVLRKTYENVVPGFHMNKTHWNSVICGGDVSDEKLCEMVRYSFELTAPKPPRKKRGKE